MPLPSSLGETSKFPTVGSQNHAGKCQQAVSEMYARSHKRSFTPEPSVGGISLL